MEQEDNTISLEQLARENGMRFWYAHDLAQYLGYKDFDAFKKRVISKAIITTEQIGISNVEEFIYTEIDGLKTYKLTRFAVFLCVMHADDTKPKVTVAKVTLAKMSDLILQAYELERLTERQKLTHGENYMESILKAKGLSRDRFALFKDSGYRGMYNMSLKKLKSYKGLGTSKKPLYDFMGITEIAANTFRVTQTAERIKSQNITNSELMNITAKDVGQEVRRIVQVNTGKDPEDLPLEQIPIDGVKKSLKNARNNLLKHDRKRK